MPIYSYVCAKCDNKFDKLFLNREAGLDVESIECPECHTIGGCRKVWPSRVGMPIFKGSGFYKTDYPNHPKDSIPKPKS